MPADCRFLFDTGSVIMDPPILAAVEKFVRAGGTFVALHNTGRHDPVAANTWPGASLTGCKVLPGPATGKIKLGRNLPILKEWEGREFSGAGTAIDWKANDHAQNASVRLQPLDDQVQVLAQWSDGSAAVTCRTLGQGQVITLGSTFWRDTLDKEGVWVCQNTQLLKSLLAGIGVEHKSEASQDAIWLNDAVTKNGIESWILAFNSTRTALTSDLKFKTDARPREVRDVLTRLTMPFDYAEGWVVLKNVSFENTQTRAFAVDRSTLVGGLPFWWAEKTKYWTRTEENPPAPIAVPDAVELGTIKLDAWKFLADRDDQIHADTRWTAAAFNDSTWDAIVTGPWNTLHADLRDYAGVGLYRTTVVIPRQWAGSSIRLNLYGNLQPCIFGNATFYVNGKKLEDADFLKDLVHPLNSPAQTSLDRLLVLGQNVLAVEIKGGANWAQSSFSGFGGTVYLSEIKPLEPSVALGADWELAQSDGTSTPAALPLAKAHAQYLARDFALPASWDRGSVYLRLDTATPSCTRCGSTGSSSRVRLFATLARTKNLISRRMSNREKSAGSSYGAGPFPALAIRNRYPRPRR